MPPDSRRDGGATWRLQFRQRRRSHV